MATKIILSGCIFSFFTITQQMIPAYYDSNAKVTTTTAAQILVDENMARLLQEFFTSVDSAVIRRDRAWDKFTTSILEKISNGLGIGGCSEKLGSFVLESVLNNLEFCEQYQLYNDKINKFDLNKTSLEREIESVSQDILFEAIGICRSTSTIVGHETECSDDPSHHIMRRFLPLFLKVNLFSLQAFSLFHLDVKEVKEKCYVSESLDALIKQAKQDNISICS